MQGKETSKIKIAIIVLSVLLAVSLALLVGTLIYNHFAESDPASVTVPDNIITPEEEQTDTQQTGQSENDGSGENGTANTPQSVSGQTGAEVTASALSLHNRNTEDNVPFKVGNMFPGDRETKYYCVRVSHKGDVTLRFRADVRPGYEKLGEVLKCRVTLSENGEVLYDGLMRDMPQALRTVLNADQRTTSEVYYGIAVYLDTSVGNEYMNKDLIADFRWWVEETDDLDVPQTGDAFPTYYLWIASGALCLLMLLWIKRKKEDAANDR